MLWCWDDDPDERPSLSCLVEAVVHIEATLRMTRGDKGIATCVTFANDPGICSNNEVAESASKETA